MRTAWIEIDEDKWWEMLEVLPPEKWKHFKGGEIFRIQEYWDGHRTEHFVRIKKGGENRYFSALRSVFDEYPVLIEEVKRL